MRWFIKEVVPLLVMLAVILVLTLVPYYSTRQTLKTDEKTQIYLCKFSAVMREFANTAANARLITAQKGNPHLKKENLHAAKIYLHVKNELKTLPPDAKCNRLVKENK